MFEKVNPSHPDKIADRIAGALIDLAYSTSKSRPKIAVEVLIGHDRCHIIAETSEILDAHEVERIVQRIGGNSIITDFVQVPQDINLATNQARDEVRCGDNGIFKGVPITHEQRTLSTVSRLLYAKYPTDGKYIINDDKFIICQSNACTNELKTLFKEAIINPLGDWTGGTGVDTGATNRKLGSDMGDSITGGGLHGKDCTKADVSVNIYCFNKSQEEGRTIEACCAIGDKYVLIDGVAIGYKSVVDYAEQYIKHVGGFEKFAEWGLV